MKSTWSGMLCLSAALAATPTQARAADPRPLVVPVSGQADLGTTERATVSFVNVPENSETTAETSSVEAQSPTPVYRKSAPSSAKPAKGPAPRLMSEPYPAQIDDQNDALTDNDSESQAANRSASEPTDGSGNAVTSRRAASPSWRLRSEESPDVPMALATDSRTERIPPVEDGQAEAPRLLATGAGSQWAAAQPLTAQTRPEPSGPVLKRAPLAARLAALQDQVPSSYVGIEGRVGAINLGDRTVKLNFDRRQPPPLGGLVNVYKVQAGGTTTCIGALEITRVYGGVATGVPLDDLRIEQLMAGDLVVFHVGSSISSSGEPDPHEAVWVSDRIKPRQR